MWNNKYVIRCLSVSSFGLQLQALLNSFIWVGWPTLCLLVNWDITAIISDYVEAYVDGKLVARLNIIYN